jgi:hypothetical protein
MGELSFLTIIVSLAVCSLLVYGIFQYMKVRLTVLEQSHREQAMILQQYIEESSSDIHRLYKITTSRSSMNDPAQQFTPNGSIILEYAEEQNNKENPVAFNEPHTIHLDTAAFFQNKRSSNLIEISSDSENTTDSDSESVDESSSESETDSDDTDNDRDSETDTDSDSDSETETNGDNDKHETIQVCGIKNEHDNTSCEIVLELDDIQAADIKTITVDLGTIEEPESSISRTNDVHSMLYKMAQQTPLPEDNDLDENITNDKTVHEPVEVSPPVHVPLSAMSVPDLKQLLKEKCKNQPEKHPEIQKLKKAELIYAIQQLQ